MSGIKEPSLGRAARLQHRQPFNSGDRNFFAWGSATAPESNSTAWSTSYSQYLARSAAISARSMNLYQLALEHVAQGKLPPTIFQDHFPAFAVAHAAEFTNRFAEVGSRFMGNLVRLGSSFPQQAGASDSAEAEAETPPEFDPSNPSRWYEQVAEYAGKLNARAVQAYRSQLDRVAAGQTTPSEVQQQTAEQMAERLPNYMQGMTQIYFNLLNELNEVRAAYEETYFRGLLVTAKSDHSDPAVTLTLSGPAGSTSTVSLAVTNTTEQRAQIAHQVSDVRRADGVGPGFVPAVAFAPEKLELDPNEEGTLTISLTLDAQQYEADRLYSGALLLAGGSEVPLRMDLRILAISISSQNSNG